MNPYRFFLLLMLFSLFTLSVRAESPHTATVASFAKTPVIDGKLAPGEWDGAVRTMGFQSIADYRGYLTDARMGSTWCGFTGERLYIAMVSEISPVGAFIQQKNRDAELISDDGIEIWLDPNRDTRATGEGDLRYYQFIGNPDGVILDVVFDPKKGAPDVGWNANWEFANTVDREKSLWTAEISIPLVDLGWKPGTALGRSIGLLISRNYKAPWTQVTWFPHKGAFVGWFEYPKIRLTKDVPSVQVESLGEKFFAGQPDFKLRITNPGPARQVKVTLKITSTDMPGVTDEEIIDLPANGTAPYAFTVQPETLHQAAQHALALTVKSADGTETYFDYATKWSNEVDTMKKFGSPSGKKWVTGSGPDPNAAVRVAYYPSYRFVRVKVDTAELEKSAAACKSAKVVIAGENGKAVVTGTMQWTEHGAVKEFKVPDLPDGNYTVAVTLDGYPTPFTRTFIRKHFPWEGNTLGITDKVLPPFEPITVKGSDIHVVLRTYRVNGLGLWDSIQAEGNVSAGPAAELLAAPMALKVNNGQVLKGSGKFTGKKDNAVVYEGKAEAPGVAVKTRCTTEYDGCMKVELTLLPDKKKRELQALWLEIPLRDQEVRLWHASIAGLRVNPAGFTPAGEGEIWDSRKLPDGNWYGNFKPYIWLGGEERGFCWFADNDRGWELNVPNPRKPELATPCQVLLRKDGVLTLRVNLVQKPVTLTAPRTIVFGLMASPAKPMPKDWRYRTFASGGKVPTISWMGSEYWGSDQFFSSKYPRNGDMSVLEVTRDLRLGNKVDIDQFVKDFCERNFKPGMPEGGRDKTKVGNVLPIALRTAQAAGARTPLNAYWEEFSTNPLHEEVKTFRSEWTGSYDWGSTGGLAPSYRDFACYYGAEFVKHGIGLYFDNCFPKRAYDPVTSSAYVLPDGSIQPSACMWAYREYLKRIWVIHHTEADPRMPVLQMIHMTNTHIIPYMVWNDANLDLEWFYGPDPAQAKYPHELLRAESLGRQSGNLPLVLAFCDGGKTPEERTMASRSRTYAMAVHEIKPSWEAFPLLYEFGYGMEDCRVYNYWNAGYPVKTSNDEQVKSLLLQRNGKLLLVLCTWSPKPETVTITLDTAALGVTPKTAVDVETKEALPMNGSTITVPLAKYGARVIRVE